MKGPMKWCAIPVLLVQVMSGGAKADFTSGNDLWDWCQANDPMKDALCTSYVLGAGETFQVLQVAKQVRFYCIAVSAPLAAADQPSTNVPTVTTVPPSATTPTGETAAPASSGPAKDFTEEDVNAAVKKTVDERSKDGVFIFHDPRLDEDLNLVYEQIKIVRGMEGYGWFANTIFHDKDEA